MHKIIEKQVNLEQHPQNWGAAPLLSENTKVVKGDLHANAVSLLNFATDIGAFDILEEDYEAFVAIYNKEIDNITKEDIDKVKQILANIKVPDSVKNGEICLIGDETADRGKNCLYILLVLFKLKSERIPYEILLSNHGSGFYMAYEKQIKGENPFTHESNFVNLLESVIPMINDNQATSAINLGKFIKKGITTADEVNYLVNTAYRPHLKVLSYSLSENNQEIMIYSHAPINMRIIENMADIIKRDFPELEMNYPVGRNPTAVELAQIIDKINQSLHIHLDSGKTLKTFLEKSRFWKGKNGVLKDLTNNKNLEYWDKCINELHGIIPDYIPNPADNFNDLLEKGIESYATRVFAQVLSQDNSPKTPEQKNELMGDIKESIRNGNVMIQVNGQKKRMIDHLNGIIKSGKNAMLKMEHYPFHAAIWTRAVAGNSQSFPDYVRNTAGHTQFIDTENTVCVDGSLGKNNGAQKNHQGISKIVIAQNYPQMDIEMDKDQGKEKEVAFVPPIVNLYQQAVVAPAAQQYHEENQEILRAIREYLTNSVYLNKSLFPAERMWVKEENTDVLDSLGIDYQFHKGGHFRAQHVLGSIADKYFQASLKEDGSVAIYRKNLADGRTDYDTNYALINGARSLRNEFAASGLFNGMIELKRQQDILEEIVARNVM